MSMALAKYLMVGAALQKSTGGANIECGVVYDTVEETGNVLKNATYFGTTVVSKAFYGQGSLKNVTFANTITEIGNYAFSQCFDLALTSLPDSVTTIGNSAFDECISLAIKSLPVNLRKIGSTGFGRCTGLTELTFKGTPDSIKSNSFNNCTNLTTINVPWAEGAVSGAPWGATNATINYNYTGA